MFIAVLIVLGLVLGSFVNALVWRLHEGKDWLKGRSECPECHHVLAAKDLVPVVSWLWLKGQCRYCGQPISWQYPLVELITVGLFVMSYFCWPMNFNGAGLFQFVIWLIMLVGFMALTVYDLRWFLLPNKIIFPLLGVAVLQSAVLAVINWPDSIVWGPLIGALIIGGLFYILFKLSGGKWIGGGDVKLGVLLGLLVGGPLMSFLLLFFASLGGTVYALPKIITGQAKHNSRVPFGPFLIIGTIVVMLFGSTIINWYEHLYF